jgi:methionyl-tRNA formyltransferase
MRMIFFGTPAFAVPSLDALLGAGIEVAAVVTQPDRARGRSHSTLIAPPVKVRAVATGVEVLQPNRPRGDVFLQTLRGLSAELGVVVAYGHLLPPEVLDIFPLGMVNVHASLLPRWRGAAPIQRALLAGDTETGVAIVRVEAGLDTGAVWLTRRVPITSQDTTGTLTDRLARLGAETLLEAMPRITNGVVPAPQSNDGVTLAAKIDRATARIHWNESTAAVSARLRAMDPAPGAWTTIAATEIKCFGPQPVLSPPTTRANPGEVLVIGQRLIVATGDGSLAIKEVQPAGKRRMLAAEWLRGGAVKIGERFE